MLLTGIIVVLVAIFVPIVEFLAGLVKAYVHAATLDGSPRGPLALLAVHAHIMLSMVPLTAITGTVAPILAAMQVTVAMVTLMPMPRSATGQDGPRRVHRH